MEGIARRLNVANVGQDSWSMFFDQVKAQERLILDPKTGGGSSSGGAAAIANAQILNQALPPGQNHGGRMDARRKGQFEPGKARRGR